MESTLLFVGVIFELGEETQFDEVCEFYTVSLEPDRHSANFLSPTVARTWTSNCRPLLQVDNSNMFQNSENYIFVDFANRFVHLCVPKPWSSRITKSRQSPRFLQEETPIIGPALHKNTVASEDPKQMERARSILNRSKTRMALMRHHLSNGDLMLRNEGFIARSGWDGTGSWVGLQWGQRTLHKNRCRISGSFLILGLVCSVPRWKSWVRMVRMVRLYCKVCDL